MSTTVAGMLCFAMGITFMIGNMLWVRGMNIGIFILVASLGVAAVLWRYMGKNSAVKG